ncbi:MAG: TonB-dependent receptor [Puniceicoccaceae bacterium]|nr:MAG: TonB-dependent receptor [Puniceicoccaceae bacterium]
MTTTPRHLSGVWTRPLRGAWALAFTCFTLCLPVLAAEAPKRSFNLPAADAVEALRGFTEQSGEQIVYPVERVRGVRTNPVRGEYTPREALEAMLAETTLSVVQDAATGALVVARDSGPNGAREEPATRQRPERGTTPRSEGGSVVLDEVRITGSRIRGLLGEAVMQPVLTLTATDIERTGATSLGEVFRYIPQVNSYTEGQFQQSPFAFGASTGDATSTRVTATLRGSPVGGTLLLINGRRAPRTGQQSGQDAYDLGGIPLSAVERIEVLLEGASAIYGADAVGGVINVILKRGYRSTDLRLSYENTFKTDVNVKSVSLTHGFAEGKLSGMVTLSYQESGNLMWRDRDFLRTQDRREWGAGNDNTAFQIPSANGTINLGAGNAAGLPAGTLLTIPSGSTGTNMTVEDFVGAGSPPPPPGTDLAIWAAYNSAIERKSALANFEYEFRIGLSAFLEARLANNRTLTTGSPLAVSNLSVPANAPGNVFGVPVTLRRYLVDLEPSVRVSENTSRSFVVGLRGELLSDWRYEGSAGYSFSRPQYTDPYGFAINAANFNEALANPDPAQRPNLFYDAVGGFNPNPTGLLESLGNPTLSLEESTAWIYEVKADGPLFRMWAGDVRMAVGAEFRQEKAKFPLVTDADLFSARPGSRDVTGVFAELRVPLVSELQDIPLVHRLEVSAAVRHDGYEEFPDATTPRFSAGYRPVSWLLARASYGEGYKVPTLSQLTAPQRTVNTFFSLVNPPLDIYRGGEPIFEPRPMPSIFGGNPNLLPEETESKTFGLVLEVPHRWFDGLSFSYDYYDHTYVNRISAMAFADRLEIFPELFTRGPNLPGDEPGWPGPIISYDNRPVNIGVNRISGWDAGVKYFRPTPIGEFVLNGNVSQATRNESRPRPGAPVTNAVFAVKEFLPMRISGSVFWLDSGWEVGALFSYRDKFKRSVNERLTPSAIRWDARVSYDFSQSNWAQTDASSWWGRALADSRLSVTIYNVFDATPPMNSAGLPDSSVVDALGPRYVITFIKSFGGR